MLFPGDPAPYFAVASNVNPRFNFDTVAGRYIVMSFFASSAQPFANAFLEEVDRRRESFDATNLAFIGVSIDPQDQQRLAYQQWPGIKFFWDFDMAVSRRFGAIGDAPASERSAVPSALDQPVDPPKPQLVYHAHTLVLDQALRVIGVMPFNGEPAAHLDQVLNFVESQPPLDRINTPAPVLVLPHVFEPELCRTLIDYYETRGGEDSGFMRDVGGKTVGITDYSHKRRSDCEIADEKLIQTCQERMARRLVPAIRQAFQFHANRIERHIVACYEAATGGHFRAHRDNTTLGTAHRRFAVTMNLNEEDFQGGELWFPEFGRRLYRAPTGGVVVFSCSLLHEATPVTQGKRYAFLPFLYDDTAARVRERNRQYIADNPPAMPEKAPVM